MVNNEKIVDVEMEVKLDKDNSDKLSELNKKILEVKKKIQLLEGQRKALFEEAEIQQKNNSEEIIRLKKEISGLTTLLHQNKSSQAKYRLKDKGIAQQIGLLGEKSSSEVENLLDLQITDKKKKIDLLKYKTKQRKLYLTDLAAKYQKYLNKQEKQELERNIEHPMRKTTYELQNDIHAIEVKVREAVHIQKKYIDVHKSLMEDSSKFESNIKQLERELELQQEDISKLQKTMDEATRMRNSARHNLLQMEKSVNATTVQKEKEAANGRRLVGERKLELERLERKIFQTGKILVRPEPEGAEDNSEYKSSSSHPVETLARQFEVLKKATGGGTTNEVYSRFESQKDTEKRLQLLREKSESEKKHLEKKLESLMSKYEAFKFTECKDSENYLNTIDHIKAEINKNIEREQICRDKRTKDEEIFDILYKSIQNLLGFLNPSIVISNDAVSLIQTVENEIWILLKKAKENATRGETNLTIAGLVEEKWLPGPYGGLIRRTPLPQIGTSPAPPPPPGSEDDDEVPSRNYLKRQAQLVIDAKLRRKNIRVQLPKRN